MQAGKRAMAIGGLVIAGAMGAAGSALAGAGPISVTDEGDDTFAPEVTSTQVNDGGVRWVWDPNNLNEHNVVQDDGLFKSGDAVPVDDDYAIDPSAGTFLYYCEIHGDKGGQGMSGKLRIAPRQVATLARGPEIQLGLEWAVAALDTGEVFDVDYRVGNGKWKHWRHNTEKLEGAFGKNNNPVAVKEGKAYSFRARSKDSSNPERKRSGWSPKVVITP